MASRQRRSRNRLTPTQARAARRARHQSRSRLKRIAIFTGVGLIAGLFILALILPGLPLADMFSSSAPDGPGQKIATQGREHVAPDQPHPEYNTSPATSGWHFDQPLAPINWGIYDDHIEDEYLIHNLEHGGIGIHYNCPDGCDELVSDLSRIADRSLAENLKVVLSPYPDMPTRIALTAWTFLDAFEEFDEGRIIEFIESHESSPTAPENLAR